MRQAKGPWGVSPLAFTAFRQGPLRQTAPLGNPAPARGWGVSTGKRSTIVPTQSDRTLAITIQPTLVWNADGSIGATFVYQQTDSQPNMPNRVDRPTGNIRLDHMPSNANYNDNVDITITMDDSLSFMSDGTTHVPLRFANAGEGNPPNDVGRSEERRVGKECRL